MSNSVHIKVVVKVGDETMVVEHRSPLNLGGDRRRWRRHIAEHIAEQTQFIGQRFNVPPMGKPTARPAEPEAQSA